MSKKIIKKIILKNLKNFPNKMNLKYKLFLNNISNNIFILKVIGLVKKTVKKGIRKILVNTWVILIVIALGKSKKSIVLYIYINKN